MAQGKTQSAKAAAVEASRLARAAKTAADKAAVKAKAAADAAVTAEQAAKQAAAAARKAATIASPGAREAEPERWFPLEFDSVTTQWQVTVDGTILTLEQLREQGKNVRVTLTLGSPSALYPQVYQAQQQLLDFLKSQFATVQMQEGTCDKQN